MKSVIKLGPDDFEGAQDIDGNIGDKDIKVKVPLNSLMSFLKTVILMSHMLAHIKTQVENPRIPERGFTLVQIMH